MAQETFRIVLDRFYQGFAPTYWVNSLSEFGNPGQANAMVDVDVTDPTHVTQGPTLSNLINGTQAGVVDELIRYIMDAGLNGGSDTFAIGSTKLFELNPSTVTDDTDFPHDITSCIEGQSIVEIGNVAYYFFNKSGAGEIGKHTRGTSTFDDDWGSTVPTGAAALQQDYHPAFAKEDIILFGNGRYAGVYTLDDDTLAPTKLDFGTGQQVADVIFHNSQWWIGVNKSTLGNVSSAQVYLYDASGVSSLLSDEMSFTIKKIGFVKAVNGTVFIAYSDSNGYWLGYIKGRSIEQLCALPSLPLFYQKSLYRGMLLFFSDSLIFSAGARHKRLPFQLSQIADKGYDTVGAIAAPFSTPLVASTDDAGSFRLAKFSGYSLNSSWTSLIFNLLNGDKLGVIDKIVVQTIALASGARADITVKKNQAATSFSVGSIATTGKTRHVFNVSITDIEDFRVVLDWANGSATNPCSIRKIEILGHYKQK